MEAELDSKQKEQRMAEERLKRREAQLAEREIDLLKRELNMMIVQTGGGTPTPKKRKGNFKKKLLKQKEEKNSSVISAPSGKIFFINKITKGEFYLPFLVRHKIIVDFITGDIYMKYVRQR